MFICRICNKNKDEKDFIKSNICIDCYNNTESSFDKNNIDLNKIRYLFIQKCNEGHIFLSKGANNKKCPKCYVLDAFCSTCGKLLDYKISEKEINDYRFCSNKCQHIHIVKKNKSPGYCSICYIYNEVRDQNARGISNCNCSKQWHIDFANTKENKIRAKENINKWNNSEEGKKFTQELNKNKKIIYSKPGKCTNAECNNISFANERSITGLCLECQRKLGQESISKWNNSEEGKEFKRKFFKEKAEKYKQSGNCTMCGSFCCENERNIVTELCKECNIKAANNSVESRLENIRNNINLLIQDKNITFNEEFIINFDLKENDIPEVWSLWGINIKSKARECLTCGQTINLNKELNWTLRVLNNDKLQDLEKEEPGCTGRWDKIQKYYTNYQYIIINKGEENKEKREILETIYAIKNNSLFWKPSITQINLNI